MLWITRERPQADCLACAWLIQHFIDSAPRFVFAPPWSVKAVAREKAAIPYDAPGAELGPCDGRSTFDAFLRKYRLGSRALDRLATIVRGAQDDRLAVSAQSAGLRSISLGLLVTFPDDHELLQRGLVLYGALYAWCDTMEAELYGGFPADEPFNVKTRTPEAS